MSGSKTRVGFSGGSDPPDGEEMRAARTQYGHDVHLRLPAEVEAPRFPVSATPVPPPRSLTDRPLPVPREIEFAEEKTRRNRQRQRQDNSRLARFLGRWTKSGHFLSKSRLDAEAQPNLSIPHDTAARNILLVLLVAALTFAVTFAVVKLGQRRAAHTAAPMEPTTTAVPPTDPLPAPPAPPPVSASPPLPSPVPAADPAPLPAAAKGLGVPPPAASARRPPRPGRSGAELLPLGQ